MITLPKKYPVACHTDNVGPGSTFVAIKGTRYNGVDFIPKALEQGAQKIVVSQEEILTPEIIETIKKYNAELLQVANARQALAQLSAQALKYPAQKLSIIAVTGTKGKSSTCFLIEHILRTAGFKTALLTSIHNKIENTIFLTELTTQHPDYLHVFLDQAVKAGVQYVVMEVAAQALSLHRVETLLFDRIIFTNFEPEHGEFYKTTNDYFEAKSQILKHMNEQAVLFVNTDSEPCKKLLPLKKGIYEYSLLNTSSSLYAQYEHTHGISLNFKETKYFCSTLYGTYNAYNMFAALLIAHSLHIAPHIIQKAFSNFTGIPGRLEKYTLANGAQCFIDKAHTPGSFKAVFNALRPLTKHLIVVFGAGGDRDPLKRPIMGALAAEYADLVIVTSDNPRSEKLESIIAQIVEGVPEKSHNKLIIELDRYQALKKAYENAKAESIILLLGKGPDEYELVQGIKYPFSERSIMLSFE